MVQVRQTWGAAWRRKVLGTGVLLAAVIACGAAPTQETHLLWGDTHLHTNYSIDAYSTGNTGADPDTAYRFARGLPVLHPSLKTRIRIDRPLDFLVVSDHAIMLGLGVGLDREDPRLLATEWGKRMLAAKQDPNGGSLFGAFRGISEDERKEMMEQIFSTEIRTGAWAELVDAAERNYQPGVFTTFSGWEWTSAPGGRNLHRVVFTTADGATAKKFIPYSNYESQRPEDLWRWLEETHARTGAEFVAIPHNSNVSDGLMFDQVDSDGRPITARYARTRMRWEPVIEVTQVKGTSEVHPALSPNDEFAEFEIRRKLLAGAPTEPNAGAYARSALLRGLEIEDRTGANPYKFGMIGSTDSHTSLSSSAENNFYGKLVVDMRTIDRYKPERPVIFPAWEMSASGLAAVWATENNREAIAAAFRRKEVYATTGTRISLRVFGGFAFKAADAEQRDIAATGYRKGTPMGGDLSKAPRGKSVTLLIDAVKDPVGANLDRVQVIKGWLDPEGVSHERIYNAAWSGERTPTPDGGLPTVGNTVDVSTASYRNSIGAPRLTTVWTDPDFVAGQRAFYYIRVLEIPTPRHTVYDAVALGIDVAETGQPASIQERAYSSPIWYTP